MQKHFLVIGITCILCSGGGARASVSVPHGVLIVEGGADLEHERIREYVQINQSEARGRSDVDDDHNGFTDDFNGWNLVSNNNLQMPGYIRNFFEQNVDHARDLLALYDRIESGDQGAELLMRLNPQKEQEIDELLNMSHATHVTAIAATNSLGDARVQNLNIFDPSELSTREPLSIKVTRTGSRARYRSVLAANDGTATESPLPAFNDKAEIEKYISQKEADLSTMSDRFSAYLQQSGLGIVNASVSWSRANIQADFESAWIISLMNRALPLSTRRSAIEQMGFERLVQASLAAWTKYWAQVIDANPEVLFVVSAGNDGVDIDNLEMIPATFSLTRANVITIVATNAEGVLTDFSNSGQRSTNLGAWGLSVPSAAPNQLSVKMSGTSMAAPFVSAVSAHVRKLNPKLRAFELRQILEQSSRRNASLIGKTSSGGMIDPNAAFRVATAMQNGSDMPTALRFVNEERSRFESSAGSGGASNAEFFNNPFGRAENDPNFGRVAETSALLKRLIRRR